MQNERATLTSAPGLGYILFELFSRGAADLVCGSILFRESL